ncbi:MAG: hypothetical protein JWR63_1356, partial [Conexibacter sp.]|nr:hypothetical protein [Conexibacter sp.]
MGANRARGGLPGRPDGLPTEAMTLQLTRILCAAEPRGVAAAVERLLA